MPSSAKLACRPRLFRNASSTALSAVSGCLSSSATRACAVSASGVGALQRRRLPGPLLGQLADLVEAAVRRERRAAGQQQRRPPRCGEAHHFCASVTAVAAVAGCRRRRRRRCRAGAEPPADRCGADAGSGGRSRAVAGMAAALRRILQRVVHGAPVSRAWCPARACSPRTPSRSAAPASLCGAGVGSAAPAARRQPAEGRSARAAASTAKVVLFMARSHLSRRRAYAIGGTRAMDARALQASRGGRTGQMLRGGRSWPSERKRERRRSERRVDGRDRQRRHRKCRHGADQRRDRAERRAQSCTCPPCRQTRRRCGCPHQQRWPGQSSAWSWAP